MDESYPFGMGFTKGQGLHLWDGGVYENLGLESVYKIDNCSTSSEDIDYHIVSNASGSIDYENRENGLSGRTYITIRTHHFYI